MNGGDCADSNSLKASYPTVELGLLIYLNIYLAKIKSGLFELSIGQGNLGRDGEFFAVDIACAVQVDGWRSKPNLVLITHMFLSKVRSMH